MSLIDVVKVPCTMLDRRSVADGRGGMVKKWVDGAKFYAAINIDGSPEMRVAEAQGVKAVYTVTTSRAVNLQYHDVFRRDEDEKIFRVTSDGDDNKTPPIAGLDMRNVTAEEWTLPAEDD